MDPLVVILMGSKSDLAHSHRIAEVLERFQLPYEMRIASAHKSPRYLLDMLQAYDSRSRRIVYVAAAGRSNALGGMLDATSTNPVINCPPSSERFAGMDILSSLRMPSGVSGATVLEPEAAAFLAAKILALGDPGLKERVEVYQQEYRERIQRDDGEMKAGAASSQEE
jgi:phosphoribosylaminoimidazole carboxylase PurE protein